MHGGSCHKDLSRQKYGCRDKTFFLPRQIFVTTNIILSPQKFCRDKHTFYATKDVSCRGKLLFVTINTYLSRQTGVFRDKKKKKGYLWQLPPMIENHTTFYGSAWRVDAVAGERAYSLLQNVRRGHARADGNPVVHQPTARRPRCQTMQRRQQEDRSGNLQ